MLFYSRDQYDTIFNFLEENYDLTKDQCKLIMKLNDAALRPGVDRNARVQDVLDGTYTHDNFLQDTLNWGILPTISGPPTALSFDEAHDLALAESSWPVTVTTVSADFVKLLYPSLFVGHQKDKADSTDTIPS